MPDEFHTECKKCHQPLTITTVICGNCTGYDKNALPKMPKEPLVGDIFNQCGFKLYHWLFYNGRGGKIDGLFLAHPDKVLEADGKGIWLGEVLGKHSQCHGQFLMDDCTMVIDHYDTIAKILINFKWDYRADGTCSNYVNDTITISGHNPFYYLEDDGDEEDEGVEDV